MDLAGRAIDLDFRDHRHAGSVALGVGDAAPGYDVAGLILARRGPRVPAEFRRRRLDDGGVARILDVPQPELDRIEVQRRGQLVHEGLAREMDLRTDRIAQVRGAQRRGAVEQRRDRLPRRPLVGELVGLRRHAEAVARGKRDPQRLPGERIQELAAVRVDIDPREALGEEVISDDVPLGIDAGAGAMDGGGALRVPAGALLAHVLQAHRLADRLRQGRGIGGAIIRIVAAVGTRAGLPDHVHVLERHAELRREADLHEVRLLRAGPAPDLAVLDLDH